MQLFARHTRFLVMTTTSIAPSRGNPWESFKDWVTSTENRLYVGWFGVLMIPTLLTATILTQPALVLLC